MTMTMTMTNNDYEKIIVKSQKSMVNGQWLQIQSRLGADFIITGMIAAILIISHQG